MKKLGSTGLCVALVLFCASALAAPAGGDAHAFDTHPAVVRARAFTSWMAVRSDHVQRWLWEARLQNDRARMRCLSRQLSQLHAIERLGNGSRRAIEGAVRARGLTGTHMVRLVHLADTSRARLAVAHRCGRTFSKRVRMKTQYSVRVIREPRLPSDDD